MGEYPYHPCGIDFTWQISVPPWTFTGELIIVVYQVPPYGPTDFVWYAQCIVPGSGGGFGGSSPGTDVTAGIDCTDGNLTGDFDLVGTGAFTGCTLHVVLS
jgi:hypothetical protein